MSTNQKRCTCFGNIIETVTTKHMSNNKGEYKHHDLQKYAKSSGLLLFSWIRLCPGRRNLKMILHGRLFRVNTQSNHSDQICDLKRNFPVTRRGVYSSSGFASFKRLFCGLSDLIFIVSHFLSSCEHRRKVQGKAKEAIWKDQRAN